MEKKVYINPQVLVFAIRPCGMLLEGSTIEIVTDPSAPPFDPNEEGITFGREDNQSSNNIWDNAW